MKRSFKNMLFILELILVIGAIIFTMNYVQNNSISSENSPPNIPANNSNMEEPPPKPEGDTIGPGDMNGQMSTMENSNQNLATIYYVMFGFESLILAAIIIYLIMSNFNRKSWRETFVSLDKIIIALLLTIILTGGITYLCAKVTNDYFLSNNSNNNTSNNNLHGGSTTNSVTYQAVQEIQEVTTIDTGTYSSNQADENVFLVNGDIDVNLSNLTINKTGDSEGGDETSFYGNNSAIIAKSGANLILKNITLTTSAKGANGVFSYGGSATTNNSSSDGTTITISDSKITTTGDNSGGIMTTGGGITKAINLTINTSGTSSAAIRSDRGGGTVTVDSGTYTTTGKGSPTIYSTANITVNDATLKATSSEATINLTNNTIINNDNTGNFIRAQKDSWGTSGNNGGIVKLNMTNQDIIGNIVIDSISTLDMTMNSNSSYEGMINPDNTAKAINLILDKTSKLILTGDSYISSLDNEDSTSSNIEFNGYKLYVDGQES